MAVNIKVGTPIPPDDSAEIERRKQENTVRWEKLITKKLTTKTPVTFNVKASVPFHVWESPTKAARLADDEPYPAPPMVDSDKLTRAMSYKTLCIACNGEGCHACNGKGIKP